MLYPKMKPNGSCGLPSTRTVRRILPDALSAINDQGKALQAQGEAIPVILDRLDLFHVFNQRTDERLKTLEAYYVDTRGMGFWQRLGWLLLTWR